MSWFKNLSTTKKLAAGFGLMGVLLLMVGALGVSAASGANAAFDLAYHRDLAGVDAANRARYDAVLMARTYRQGMLMSDPSAKESFSHELASNEHQTLVDVDALNDTCIYEESHRRLAEVKIMVAEYARLGQECIRLSGSDPAKAMEVLKTSSPLGIKIREDIEAVLKVKQKLASDGFDQSQTDYVRSRNLVILGVLVALMFALGSVGVIGRVIARPLAAAAAVLERVATGDMTAQLAIDSEDEVGQMGKSLNRAIDGMRTALTEVRTVANEVASASQQLASASDDISGGAQKQASSLEETAASLEEITSTVKQNADNAQQAAQLASGSRDVAEKGGTVVAQAVRAMGDITDASKRIGDITATIDEIAFQTNLLALNAAVEAARAGEQGRGFAVVAAEVRSLAQRSGAAAKEIRGLINDSVNKVEAGSKHVAESGRTLEEIVGSVKRVTDMVSEIAAASREQNTGIDQVNQAVTQMDQVTQTNASQTEELSSTAESLSTQAAQLQGLVGRFRLDDGHTAPAVHRATAAKPTAARRGARKTAAAPIRTRRAEPLMLPASIPPESNGVGPKGFDEF